MIHQFKKDLELEEFSMIAGNAITLTFEVYDKNDRLLNLNVQREIIWTLGRCDDRENIIVSKSSLGVGELEISSDEQGVFTVNIFTEDTMDLETNVYEYEVLIVTHSGQIIKPAYGKINIKECVKYQ